MTELALIAHPDLTGHPGVIIGTYPTQQAADADIARFYAAADKHRAVLTDDNTQWTPARPLVSLRPVDSDQTRRARSGRVAFLAAGNGTLDDVSAYKRWGQTHGFEGSPGGYIRRTGNPKPVCQGWASLRHHVRDTPVVKVGNVFRVVERIGFDR